MGCSVQDTFYVDPRVEGCDGLSSRAKRLGLRLKGFLGEGVTVCVAASSSGGAGGGGGRGGNEGAGDETGGAGAGTGAGLSRGQRLSRIHRMVIQAQTEPTTGSGLGGRRHGHPCIADQARQLRATVLSGKAFGLWLERQEAKRATTQGRGTAAGAGAAGAGGGKGEASARPLISRGQRAATSRFKSQEHPRVVMKDLDGLEPDRVQAFPPELLRKCNLHTDAPPGICPFIPREQWDREVLKMKKKDALCGAAKVAARMPPAGAQKPRRGGWCECCERQYIGTMSEHCAGDQHRAAVAADPNYAILLELESWTGSDAECLAQTAAHEPSPVASTVSSSSPVAAAVAAAAEAAGVGAGRGDVASTVEAVASATNEYGKGRERPLAPAAESDISLGERCDAATKPGTAAGRASATHRRRGFSSPARGGFVNAKQETSSTKEDSALLDAVPPSAAQDAAGARTDGRVLRSSPRRYPRPGQQASLAPCSEAGGGEGEERVSPKTPPSVEPPRPGSPKSSQRGGSRGSGGVISSREASNGGDSTGVVAGTPPQQSTATKRSTRSSPLPCSSSTPEDACVAMALDKGASGLGKSSGGVGSPAAAAADTPATSTLSNPPSQTDRSKRSSSGSSSRSSSCRKKARCSSESPPACTPARDSAFSPPSSRRSGRNLRRLGSSPGGSCKGEAAGPRSGAASPAVGAEMVRRNSRASHGDGVEACSSATASGGSGTSPSGRADGTDTTTVRNNSPTHSAPRVAGEKRARVSAPSPLSDDKQRDKERTEKRIKRQLKLLEDSPDFHGSGPSPAGSTSRVRTCDARGRSVTTGVTTSGSGSRRSSRDHRDGDGGSVTKMGSNGKARRADNRSAPSGGSRKEEWRVKKKRQGRNEDEAGGSPSTDSGSPCESGAQNVGGGVGGNTEKDADGDSGGIKSARAGRRRGCASSPDVPREGERLKRLPVGSRGDKGSSSTSRGGTRNGSKRRTPSTARRMGLETAGDSSDDSADSSAEDARQQSLPPSSERSRSVPRSLGSRFAEDHGNPTAPVARRKHAAVGANSERGPLEKRARATLPRSPRIRA